MNENMQNQPPLTRRNFIKTSSAVAVGVTAAVNFPSVLRGQAAQTFNAAIIGCGGRGMGAGRNFLDAAKAAGVEAKIVAAADIFPEASKKAKDNFGVADDACFSGWDGYQKALAVPGVNYAIIAGPPGVRPFHFKAAVETGKHCFIEKPVAADGPGCRIMYECYEKSKQKGLKVAAGTQRRHQATYIDTVKRIQDGAIGDVQFMRAYWVNGGPIWHRGDKGETEMEKQVRNWYHYIWLSGDHICEQHVHNIDVCNWVMNATPVKAWGSGGRGSLGNKSGHIWDHFAIEFEYANGVRMYSYCGQQKRTWSSVSESIHGSKGFSNPSGTIMPKDGARIRSAAKGLDPYVQEHVDLLNSIVKSTDLNEAKQVTDSTLTAIMGREAAYSGALVEWDQILNSKFTYTPAKMEWGPAPIVPVPEPGQHDIFKA
jgi:predicted dehydrogenase